MPIFGWRKGRLSFTIIKENSMERASVAVRCPSCGKVAETEVVGPVLAVWPDNEINIMHPDCDLHALYRALTDATEKLHSFWS